MDSEKLTKQNQGAELSEQLLSEVDAAKLLTERCKREIAHSTLRYWRQHGRIKHYRLSNGRVAYATAHLNEFLMKAVAA